MDRSFKSALDASTTPLHFVHAIADLAMVDELPDDIDPQEMVDEREEIIERARALQSVSDRWIGEAHKKVGEAKEAIGKDGSDKQRVLAILDELRRYFNGDA